MTTVSYMTNFMRERRRTGVSGTPCVHRRGTCVRLAALVFALLASSVGCSGHAQRGGGGGHPVADEPPATAPQPPSHDARLVLDEDTVVEGIRFAKGTVVMVREYPDQGTRALLAAQLSQDHVIRGLAFARGTTVKFSASVPVEGVLAVDAVVGGIPLAAGHAVVLDLDGKPLAGVLARKATQRGVVLAAGSALRFDDDGVMTATLARATIIGDVEYSARAPVEIAADGGLRSGSLAREQTIDAISLPRDTLIRFGRDHLESAELPPRPELHDVLGVPFRAGTKLVIKTYPQKHVTGWLGRDHLIDGIPLAGGHEVTLYLGMFHGKPDQVVLVAGVLRGDQEVVLSPGLVERRVRLKGGTRIERHGESLVGGTLAETAVISGVAYAAGSRIAFHDHRYYQRVAQVEWGVAAKDQVVGAIRVPAGVEMGFDGAGALEWLRQPKQGQRKKPARPVVIDGRELDLEQDVWLDPRGRVRQAKLAKDARFPFGRLYGGTSIHIGEDGSLVRSAPPPGAGGDFRVKVAGLELDASYPVRAFANGDASPMLETGVLATDQKVGALYLPKGAELHFSQGDRSMQPSLRLTRRGHVQGLDLPKGSLADFRENRLWHVTLEEGKRVKVGKWWFETTYTSAVGEGPMGYRIPSQVLVLYPSGKIMAGALAEDATVGGVHCMKGHRVVIDEGGRVIAAVSAERQVVGGKTYQRGEPIVVGEIPRELW